MQKFSTFVNFVQLLYVFLTFTGNEKFESKFPNVNLGIQRIEKQLLLTILFYNEIPYIFQNGDKMNQKMSHFSTSCSF